MSTGDAIVSQTWNLGIGAATILRDKYNITGAFGDVNIFYKTGVTKVACEADSWHVFPGQFMSLGWVKIKVTV